MRSCPVASLPHQGHQTIQSSTPRVQWGQLPSYLVSSFHPCGLPHQGHCDMGYMTRPPQPQSQRVSRRNPFGFLIGVSAETPSS